MFLLRKPSDCRLFLSVKRTYLERKEARAKLYAAPASKQTPSKQPHPQRLVPKHARKSEKANAVEEMEELEELEEFEFVGQASSSHSSIEPLSDDWISDSEASCHLTSRGNWMFEKVVEIRPVRVANGETIFRLIEVIAFS
jgi:hypothetical protein